MEAPLLCVRCNKNPIKYKTRKLCASCYVVLHRQGNIKAIEYPTRCSYEKCRTPQERKMVKGLCWNCYYRQKNRGTLEYDDRTISKCSIPNCVKDVVSKGLCDTHRRRVERHGDVHAGRPQGWGDLKARRLREYAKNRAAPPRVKRNKHLKKHFKITIEDYEAMLAAQGGVCAISGKVETRIDSKTGNPMSMSLDHDKTNGRVCGILTANCNTGIGLFHYSARVMCNAVLYLIDTRAGIDMSIDDVIQFMQKAKENRNESPTPSQEPDQERAKGLGKIRVVMSREDSAGVEQNPTVAPVLQERPGAESSN